MKRSRREVLFFILVFLLFFIVSKACCRHIQTNLNINRNISFLVFGAIYTVVIIFCYWVAQLFCSNSEGFWDVSPFAKCKGTQYMWQGDSAEAKLCREMADTTEGRIGISSYNCPKGYNGQPSLPFYYTPLSDDNYENERCENKPQCPGKDVGLCSMEAQVQN